MWNKIVDFVSKDELTINDFAAEEDLLLATAVLFVHTATVDESFHKKEYDEIHKFLMERFGFSDNMIEMLIKHANRTNNEILDVDHFIEILNRHMSLDARRTLAKMIWYVVLADGVVRPCEDRLFRDLCPRLGVPVAEQGAIKDEVMRDVAKYEDPIRKILQDAGF